MTTKTEILEPVPGLVTVIVHPGGVANVTVLNPGTDPAPPAISADPGNRATLGTDNGVYVRDDLIPDPLAYYILAKA